MAKSLGQSQKGLRWAIICALLCGLAGICSAGPLMAVDFGGESLRVSLVKPGRTPVSVVLNEASKRKTSAQVAFVGQDRLLGDEAAALNVRYPDRVYARTKDLLGLPLEGAAVQEVLSASKLPYNVVPASTERGTAAISGPDGEIHTAEELVASILHYARSITETAAEGAAILDCVITVPAFWGPSQRQALIDAAKISGVNVLALINMHAAAALLYGIERDFSNSSQLVVFYDMGATNTEAALVKYSTFSVKEAGVSRTYGQFEVLDVAWDATLGSEALDMILLDHFAEEFHTSHPSLDPRTSPKATAKLRRQVKRTKEVLSANSFAPISVEELMDGHDFRSRIDRAEFEELSAPLIARVAAPLTQILERSGVAVADLSAVELLGGGSRVPAVKAALSEALGGRNLDMHLDADEAVVLGAGLYAANLSTTFRLRKFGMKDGITYPVTIELEYEGAEESSSRPRLLLPRMKYLPVRRLVPLPNDTAVDSMRVHLSFNTSAPGASLPQGLNSPRFATYDISGIQAALANHNGSARLSLHFKADESGLVSLEKGEALSELTEEYTTKVPVLPKDLPADLAKVLENFTSPDSSDAENATVKESDGGEEGTEGGKAEQDKTGKGEAGGSEEGEADKEGSSDKEGGKAKDKALPKLTYRDVTKTRKKTIRTPLKVGGAGMVLPGLSQEALKVSKKKLEKLAADEAARKEASKQKNELEAYIIAFQGRLSDEEGPLHKVTTKKQREAFDKALAAAEEWLYSEGEDQAADVFVQKQAELRKTGDAFSLRAAELSALPKALKGAQSFLKVTKQAVAGWATTKPWLNATEVKDLSQQVEEAEAWLKKEEGRQKKRKPHEDPLLLSADIDARLETLRKPFNRLKSRKKPKPPPAPKPSNTTAANTTEEEEAAAAGGEGEAEVEVPEGGSAHQDPGLDDGGEPGSEDVEVEVDTTQASHEEL